MFGRSPRLDPRLVPPSGPGGLEGVIEPDDRQEVRVAEIGRYAPWRWICSLEGYLDGDPEPKVRGTGWLVGPRDVVTAGHCLFSQPGPGQVQRLDRIRVIPGRSGQSAGYGDQVAASFCSGWEIFGTEVMGERSQDFGVVRLPRPFTKVEGNFRLRPQDRPEDLTGQWINVAGYPALHPTLPALGEHLLWHGEAVRESDERFIRYGVDTSEGQSGAPVFLARPDAEAEDRIRAVAIHLRDRTEGSGGCNEGLVLTAPVVEAIRSWLGSENSGRSRRGPILSWRRWTGRSLHG